MIRDNGLTPIWNEQATWAVENPDTAFLSFEVFDSDYGTNDLVGSVAIRLLHARQGGSANEILLHNPVFDLPLLQDIAIFHFTISTVTWCDLHLFSSSWRSNRSLRVQARFRRRVLLFEQCLSVLDAHVFCNQFFFSPSRI